MTTILFYCTHILWQNVHTFKSIVWQNFRIYMQQLLYTREIYMPVVMVFLTAGNARKKCGMATSSGMILMHSSMKVCQVAQRLLVGVVHLLADA
jgi:tryptophan-rich sensory protein